jgi:hypothetical protein
MARQQNLPPHEEPDEEDVPKWVHSEMTPAPGPSREPVRKAVRREKITGEPDPQAEKERKRLMGEIEKKLPGAPLKRPKPRRR